METTSEVCTVNPSFNGTKDLVKNYWTSGTEATQKLVLQKIFSHIVNNLRNAAKFDSTKWFFDADLFDTVVVEKCAQAILIRREGDVVPLTGGCMLEVPYPALREAGLPKHISLKVFIDIINADLKGIAHLSTIPSRPADKTAPSIFLTFEFQ